ncbi:sensor histidine kinase [Methylocystis bryophila]|uniref:sensor histidine kinase n=1 Tax=Methylocystis bryophila TaxID=655015 RepID=UPI00131A32D0|nr:ATP-binding protein [Methylocystis bryophila]
MIARVDLSEQIASRLRAEQLTAVMRLFWAGTLSSFCNSLVFLFSSIEEDAFLAVLTWAIVVWSLLGLIALRQWRRRSISQRGPSNSRRGVQHLIFYAIALGVAWAALPFLFFAHASLGGRLLIACLTTGMLGGGVFMLASVPAAAVAFSGPIAIGALFVLLRVGDTQHVLIAVVLIGYLAVLLLGAFNYEKELKTLIATQIASEQKASASAKNLGAMADVTAALAHELSQPLSAATAHVQTAERLSRVPAEERSLPIEVPLRDAVTQLDNLRQVIAHLRNSIEGRLPEKQLLHLHKVIRSVLETNQHRCEQLNIEIEASLTAQNDAVVANPVQMRQLFSNLISNAFDAMENSAERRLTISSSAVEDNAIRIDVADSGVGISPAVKTKLFEPLVTTKAQGLGVGLSIIHSIVKEHRGQIWIEPNPGGGAVFALILPVTSLDERDEAV